MGEQRKRLLVTGASGFLGSRIVLFYGKQVQYRYDVYAPSHKEMEITERESVEQAFCRFRPDYVIHCAAVSDVRACEKEPERSWKINVDGSRNIAEASARYHAKCLIAGSDQVYFGSRKKEPHREDETLYPQNVYGREKLGAEEECLDVNPKCVLLRLSWMYDVRTVREKEHGDFFRTLALKRKVLEPLEYPVYDRRGITDVNEVVGNLEKAFMLKGGVYNFGSPNDRNTYETVRALFEALEWDTARLIKNEESFAGEPRNLCMDLSKIQEHGIFFRPTVRALTENCRHYCIDREKERRFS
ncbi:MAG TPA: hypothetical protein DCZ91_05020 [Lachnospiraceae bacterium]|nr:hypothetical protein [Lachnospiraceae bacterium]